MNPKPSPFFKIGGLLEAPQSAFSGFYYKNFDEYKNQFPPLTPKKSGLLINPIIKKSPKKLVSA
jgi:hypothetical protein